MYLSDKQLELQATLNAIRKQIELLDSHRVVGLINEKQYKESLFYITQQLDQIEQNLGMEPHEYNASDIIYRKSMEGVNDDSN